MGFHRGQDVVGGVRLAGADQLPPPIVAIAGSRKLETKTLSELQDMS
jgi:hypothetical protein